MGGYGALYHSIKINLPAICLVFNPQTFNNMKDEKIYFADNLLNKEIYEGTNLIPYVNNTNKISEDITDIIEQAHDNLRIFIVVGKNECTSFGDYNSDNTWLDLMHTGNLFKKKNVQIIVSPATNHAGDLGLDYKSLANLKIDELLVKPKLWDCAWDIYNTLVFKPWKIKSGVSKPSGGRSLWAPTEHKMQDRK